MFAYMALTAAGEVKRDTIRTYTWLQPQSLLLAVNAKSPQQDRVNNKARQGLQQAAQPHFTLVAERRMQGTR